MTGVSATPRQLFLRVLATGLRERFDIREPRISVLGLNPHAGESGHLGHEDAEIIAPVIETRLSEERDSGDAEVGLGAPVSALVVQAWDRTPRQRAVTAFRSPLS